MNIPWSYTLLNTLETCPHQAYRRYLRKDVPFEQTPAMRQGEELHKMLQQRIQHGIVLPAKYEQHEPLCAAISGYRAAAHVEEALGVTEDQRPCDFWDHNVWGRGRIDLAVCSAPHAIILDWKTGSPRENPFELEVQAYLLKINYPKLETIVGRYVWLRENRLGPVHDLSDTLGTLKRIRKMLERADGYAAKEDWPKTKTPLCGWCNVKDCEHNPKRNAA